MAAKKRQKNLMTGQVINTASDTSLQPDKLSQTTTGDFIPFGDRNMFPNECTKLARESVNHRAIINSKVTYIESSGIILEKVSEKLQRSNINKVYHNCLLDYHIGGNAYYEVVTDKNKSYIKLFPIDFTKVRYNKEYTGVIIAPDWQNYRKDSDKNVRLPFFPNMVKGADGQYHSVVCIKDYEPEFNYYGVPNWFAGLRSASISRSTNYWNISRLDNEFGLSGIMVFTGVNDVETAKKLETKLKTFKGAGKNGKVMPVHMPDLGVGETRTDPKFIEMAQSQEGNWLGLHQRSDDDLIMIHSWYRSLCAMKENTGFDTQRILNDWKVARATVIRNTRNLFLNSFKQVLEAFGVYDELEVKDIKPIEEVSQVKYIWEVRRDEGLSYDENDPAQKLFFAELGASSYLNIRERFLISDEKRYKEKYYSDNGGGQK